MGIFIYGQHHSYTSELGPNERFGIADDMEFHDFVLALKKQKEEQKRLKNKKTSKNIA